MNIYESVKVMLVPKNHPLVIIKTNRLSSIDSCEMV